MSTRRRVNDLIGFGEIVRHFREFATFLIQHRSERQKRFLENRSHELRNEEQMLKNQDRKLKYARDLLALAAKYDCQPATIQGLTHSIASTQEVSQVLPVLENDHNGENQLGAERTQIQILFATSSSPQRRVQAKSSTKSV